MSDVIRLEYRGVTMRFTDTTGKSLTAVQNVSLAVRDGEVYKVTIAANGYGKMLYIRHADGYVSTYAHLKGFNERITRAVRAEQLRRGTYPVDMTFAPGEIKVKKGETVAGYKAQLIADSNFRRQLLLELTVAYDMLVQERVEVTGEAPVIETTTAALSNLVSPTQMRDLPLNGRSVDQLALLSPGVVNQTQAGRYHEKYNIG